MEISADGKVALRYQTRPQGRDNLQLIQGLYKRLQRIVLVSDGT